MSQESGRSSRIAYIDGLRGMAIALVVLHHAYEDLLHTGHDLLGSSQAIFRLIGAVGTRGYLGVPLFFVLSGFCLSYPALKRRAAGKDSWFVASEFFARRCLRILPPYYVALILFILVNVVVTVLHMTRLEQHVGPLNLLTHLFLVHNLTVYHDSIDGPFWSLGLEWQWYWVFPLLLFLALRAPRFALLACLASTVGWHFLVQHLSPSVGYLEGMALPGTLLMFCYGVIVARLIVAGWKAPTWLLALGSVAPILLAEIPITQQVIGAVGLYESCYGLAFASLTLLGATSSSARSAFSWAPLVWLGVISYSLYLIHQPLMAAFSVYAARVLHGSPMTMVLAAALAIGAAAVFHRAVERPCMSPETWRRVAPILNRLLAWTDAVYSTRPAARVETEVPHLLGAEQLP